MGHDSRDQWQRSLFGLLALILWSTTVAVTRTLSEQVGTFTSASYSYALGGIIGIAYISLSRNRIDALRRLPRGYVLGCGGLFVFYNIALYLAIGLAANRLQVLGVGLINYMWSAMILVFSVIILKRRARILPLSLGLIISIAGAYLAVIQNASLSWSAFLAEMSASPVPYLLSLGAAISWGLYSVLNKQWTERSDLSDGHLIVPPVFLISGGILLAAKPFFHEVSTWSSQAFMELLYLSLFPWLMAYALWTLAAQGGKIVFLGVLSMFLPLISTVVSCFYLKVIPGSVLWVSCALTIIGAAICMRSIRDQSV
ncbi:EamA family transporter [Desulfosarcina ovata]|uniref:Aromatic amino acid exporter n=2 Tax=Desulfosarcina ovata TaxID=83564 RepID=A0A5K8ACA1_9BACT|nr:EamA family transporter [Desulfosarcina ovata]BBO83024.1 aromatic amino acid exporter [Desulfosarcina ovata subsp. sediminis]BBO90247.1 aromatic amino acid exporter [Desulfosarcina ovata subsp. ovata]